ncbi:hypothetical protein [Amycolatopsis sp. lyj-346]|uniref:hypothetical protein n=1 Tax=Amycolatopsis sp. lyj-346 TaxID=2789289 RepID=UPI0039787327
MNVVESAVNTTTAPPPLALAGPGEPVSAICDRFFAHGGGGRVTPPVPGPQADLSVGELLGMRSG